MENNKHNEEFTELIRKAADIILECECPNEGDFVFGINFNEQDLVRWMAIGGVLVNNLDFAKYDGTLYSQEFQDFVEPFLEKLAKTIIGSIKEKE